MRRTTLVAALLGLAFVAAPLSASAENRLPLKYSERPLTITQGMIAVQGALDFFKIEGIDPIISLIADVSFGITDDFEVNVVAVPLVLSPDTEYGNPQLSATFRFLRTAVELGVFLGLNIPVNDDVGLRAARTGLVVPNGSDFALTIGVPALFGLTQTTKIVSGLYLPITFGEEPLTGDTDIRLGLLIPVEFAVSLTPQFFLDFFSGFNVPDLDAGDVVVPLGVGFGYTLAAAADQPLGDLFGRFFFPTFINSGSNDTLVFEVIEFQIGGRFFLN